MKPIRSAFAMACMSIGAACFGQGAVVAGPGVAAGAGPMPPAAVADFKTREVAWCGVGTREMPDVLADQLRLTPDMGLVVDLVEPGSPAEKSGLKVHDVLLKLDDQKLVNPEQLRSLVRMKKPGASIKFAVIRQGQPRDLAVELGRRDVPAEEMFAVQPMRGVVRMAPDGNVMFEPQMADWAAGGGQFARANVNGQIQTVWSDREHTLNLEMKEGKAVRMTARDREGKSLFDGAVETEAQRKALPPELGAKLQQAETGGPMRVDFNVVNGARFGGPERPRFLTVSDKETLLVVRFEKQKAVHALAFSPTTGKLMVDGPVATDEQRKALPPAVAAQLKTLEENQSTASEFGALGR